MLDYRDMQIAVAPDKNGFVPLFRNRFHSSFFTARPPSSSSSEPRRSTVSLTPSGVAVVSPLAFIASQKRRHASCRRRGLRRRVR
ncbi:hypothetical protein BT93_L3848 [Corymbia citriodora subsp. variegata]|uniref:Uncharacterized protein n=1 Tax=Corymbia citriodora subsp. variegata TaxID=360336 RepID=A0A8T0CIU3_CORYI|nr:hypothetical protein BT93_L3848 [Corymbia citriodora subsp. variegata]